MAVMKISPQPLRFNALGAAVFLSALLAGCGGGTEETSTPGTQGAAGRERAQAVAAFNAARWTTPQTLPLVPASAANLPDGTVDLSTTPTKRLANEVAKRVNPARPGFLGRVRKRLPL